MPKPIRANSISASGYGGKRPAAIVAHLFGRRADNRRHAGADCRSAQCGPQRGTEVAGPGRQYGQAWLRAAKLVDPAIWRFPCRRNETLAADRETVRRAAGIGAFVARMERHERSLECSWSAIRGPSMYQDRSRIAPIRVSSGCLRPSDAGYA